GRRLRINGRVIDPAVIERELRKHPDVENAVVTAEEDAAGAVTLTAYVVRKAGTLADAAAVQRALKANLPAAANPRAIVVIEARSLAGGAADGRTREWRGVAKTRRPGARADGDLARPLACPRGRHPR